MRRVLIVEDDLATLFAMKRLFARQGWEVSKSKSVAGAMALLDPTPDWIILDIGLSDGDGEDVLRHVRHAGLTSRIAIVSGLLDPERLERLSSLEPDLLLQKPIRFEELIKACRVGDETEGTTIQFD